MIIIILQILIALIYSYFLEYYTHKMLHKFNKKDQFLAFHMRDHHVRAKRQQMIDNFSKREMLSLISLTAIHIPLLYFAPAAFITLIYCALQYLYVHSKSHSDIIWGYKNAPWHIDHHLGNQQANWGVRSDWVDRLMGTCDQSFSKKEIESIS